MPAIATVATYAILTCLWSTIFVFYLLNRRKTADYPFAAMLLSVLALDAFKSALESGYFGLVWGCQYGVLSPSFQVLGRPGPLMAVKLVNLAVAAVVVARLLRTWIPALFVQRQMQRVKFEGVSQVARDIEQSFHAAFQTTPDAMCIVRFDDGVIVAVNEGYTRMSGWSESEAVGRTSVDLGLWIDVEQRKRLFEELSTSGASRELETTFHKRGGGEFHCSLTSRVFTVGERKFFLTVARDITERKRNESLRAALYRIAQSAGCSGSLQELLGEVHRIIADLMPVPNFYIALYDEARSIFHFPYAVDEHDELPSVPTDLEGSLTKYVFRTGKALAVDEPGFQELVRAGEVREMGAPCDSWIGVPLKTQDRTVGVLAAQCYTPTVRYEAAHLELLTFVSTQIAHAIQRKQGEEALRASERRFRAVIDNASDGICLLDAAGLVRPLNPGGQVLGQGWLLDVVHPEDVATVRQKLDEAHARPSVPVVAQGRVVSADGHRPVELIFTNLLDEPAVRGVVLNVRDLSERKQLEARLLAADRMVSVGTLAAGVAHEINNPLAYVIANLEMVADERPQVSESVAELIKAAQEGAERVRLIVRDLKTFSRADERRHGPIDVHHVLEASVSMAGNEIRHRARLVREYGTDVPRIVGNEGRLGQVVLNLLVNASQAIPEGSVEANQITLRTFRKGDRVVIAVRDSGAGIAPEHHGRLFEPFFTTKPVGVGTGLGLYICRQIVESMGGTISVESVPGSGTTFAVELPIGSSGAQSPSLVNLPAPPVRRARILSVDDEPRIGSVLKQALAPHEVVDLTSAEQALERIRKGERFDLIFCDLMMPRVTGMDFHAALAVEAPEQARRTVFLTGGAFTARAHAFLDQVENPRVEKPFNLAGLRALVAERLQAFRGDLN